MADFFTNYAQPQQRTSLADMVNTAQGIQSYQQAQQLNPLQVQAAQANLQSAQQEAQKGGIQLQQLQQANQERLTIQDMLQKDPNQFMTDGKFDGSKMIPVFSKLAPNYGPEYANRLLAMQENHTKLEKSLNELDDQDSARLARFQYSQATNGVKDTGEYINNLDNFKSVYKSPSMDKAIDAEKKLVENIKSPNQLQQYIKTTALNRLPVDEQKSLTAGSVQVTPSGQTVTTMPGTFGQTPTATVGIAGGLQQPEAPTGIQGSQMGSAFDHNAPTQLPHPVRKSNQPYMPDPTEAEDTSKGTTFRQSLINAQSNLVTAKRNNQETLQTVDEIQKQLGDWSTGWTSKVAREYGKFAGTELGQKYTQLSKDIANQQLAAMNDAQLKTDAGKHLASLASGDETYPPSVLRNIVRRNDAQLMGTDMQATAAQNFYRKYGDNNMAAFQQNWSKNADSRLFEANSIVNSIQDPAQQKVELDKIIPKDPAQRKIFLEKWRNLKKLTATGEL